MNITKEVHNAKDYAPYIRYHTHEKYFMMNVDKYFDLTKAISDVYVYPEPSKKLGPYIARDWKKCDTPKTIAIYKKKVPVYFRILQSTNTYYIVYYIFYAWNGNYRIAGLVPVESHMADIEIVIAEFSNSDHRFIKYMLSAHGDFYEYGIPKKGVSKKHNIDITPGGHPIVYSSLHGHGMFNELGAYWHLYGFANSVANKGKGTQTEPIYLENSNRVWLWQYPKYIGNNGVPAYNTITINSIRKHLKKRPLCLPIIVPQLAYSAYLIVPIVVVYVYLTHTSFKYEYSELTPSKICMIVSLFGISMNTQFIIFKLLLTYVLKKFASVETEYGTTWLMPFSLVV